MAVTGKLIHLTECCIQPLQVCKQLHLMVRKTDICNFPRYWSFQQWGNWTDAKIAELCLAVLKKRWVLEPTKDVRLWRLIVYAVDFEEWKCMQWCKMHHFQSTESLLNRLCWEWTVVTLEQNLRTASVNVSALKGLETFTINDGVLQEHTIICQS